MTTKEKIKLIDELISRYKEYKKAKELIYMIFASIEGPLQESMDKIIDSYCNAVGAAIGDDFEYVQWYIFENDCGGRQLKCSFGAKDFQIKSVTDLVNFIELAK